MFDHLLESERERPKTRTRAAMAIAAALHVVVVLAVVGAGYLVVGTVVDPDLTISLVLAGPPPPPPPPPPPAGASGSRRPVEVRPPELDTVPEPLVQPHEVPVEIPDLPLVVPDADLPDGGEGVPGGVEGGVAGGTVGGTLGGTQGGQLGGRLGGVGDEVPRIVDGTIEPPVLIEKVTPDYPEIARRVRLEGRVILQAVIGTLGRVDEVTILRSSNAFFDEAAIDAVRRWRYAPATQGGRPVSVYFTVIVDFRLH